MVCALIVQAAFALEVGILMLGAAGALDHPGLRVAAGTVALALALAAVAAAAPAVRFIGHHRRERTRAGETAGLMDTVLSTSREWLWAVDDRGFFTFSSRASAAFLGYDPAELIGQPCSLVLGAKDFARARSRALTLQDSEEAWTGAVVRCTHRDGSPVWLDFSGKVRAPSSGRPGGFEGTSRLLPPRAAQERVAQRSRARIQDMISRKLLLTVFQPIHDLATGHVLGAEALCRFVSDDGACADYWFEEATAVGLGADLDLAALETALTAAAGLPANMYVSLNLAPATCLDSRLPRVLENARLPLHRIVLELTEHLAVTDYDALIAALAPLRHSGLRIAVDDAGAGFASMRHILRLRPDIIKLDRSLIAGIDQHAGQYALGAAMVGFAGQIGATLVAEGIETSAELVAVTSLGMNAGQGYHLGRPAVQPRTWAAWHTGAQPGNPGPRLGKTEPLPEHTGPRPSWDQPQTASPAP